MIVINFEVLKNFNFLLTLCVAADFITAKSLSKFSYNCPCSSILCIFLIFHSSIFLLKVIYLRSCFVLWVVSIGPRDRCGALRSGESRGRVAQESREKKFERAEDFLEDPAPYCHLLCSLTTIKQRSHFYIEQLKHNYSQYFTLTLSGSLCEDHRP